MPPPSHHRRVRWVWRGPMRRRRPYRPLRIVHSLYEVIQMIHGSCLCGSVRWQFELLHLLYRQSNAPDIDWDGAYREGHRRVRSNILYG